MQLPLPDLYAQQRLAHIPKFRNAPEKFNGFFRGVKLMLGYALSFKSHYATTRRICQSKNFAISASLKSWHRLATQRLIFKKAPRRKPGSFCSFRAAAHRL
jgi:hypothetical protein